MQTSRVISCQVIFVRVAFYWAFMSRGISHEVWKTTCAIRWRASGIQCVPSAFATVTNTLNLLVNSVFENKPHVISVLGHIFPSFPRAAQCSRAEPCDALFDQAVSRVICWCAFANHCRAPPSVLCSHAAQSFNISFKVAAGRHVRRRSVNSAWKFFYCGLTSWCNHREKADVNTKHKKWVQCHVGSSDLLQNSIFLLCVEVQTHGVILIAVTTILTEIVHCRKTCHREKQNPKKSCYCFQTDGIVLSALVNFEWSIKNHAVKSIDFSGRAAACISWKNYETG